MSTDKPMLMFRDYEPLMDFIIGVQVEVDYARRIAQLNEHYPNARDKRSVRSFYGADVQAHVIAHLIGGQTDHIGFEVNVSDPRILHGLTVAIVRHRDDTSYQILDSVNVEENTPRVFLLATIDINFYGDLGFRVGSLESIRARSVATSLSR